MNATLTELRHLAKTRDLPNAEVMYRGTLTDFLKGSDKCIDIDMPIVLTNSRSIPNVKPSCQN